MIYYDKQIDGIRVVVWHVTEEYEELLSMLPDADSVQNEAEQQFSSEFRRVEWTAVRVLLYTVLDRQVHINYNDQGAPLLPDYEGLHISISHTKGFVAIALSESDVVGIDEAQFFDMGLVDVCNQLANSGVRVIIAGLDMDFKGIPFGPIPALCAIADEVTKVHAICVRCGALAYVSHRLVHNNNRVLLGEKEEYEPLCRECYRKVLEEDKLKEEKKHARATISETGNNL